MKRISTLSCTLLILVAFTLAQEQTSDGGYLIVGATDSYTHGYGGVDPTDVIICKLDGAGDVVWSDHPGGLFEDAGISAFEATDGDIIVVGMGKSFSFPTFSPLVARYDHDGSLIRQTVVTSDFDDLVLAARPTADGGCVMAGGRTWFPESFTIDFLVVKADADGRGGWTRTYGGAGQDFASAVATTTDGGYLVAGMSRSYTHGDLDILIYKLDAAGNKQWRKNYGGVQDDIPGGIIQTADGGIVVTGTSRSYTHGANDILVYHLDAAGAKRWRKNYGGVSGDTGLGVRQTADGGFLLGGHTWSYGSGASDLLVYKIDGSGLKRWRRTYGGTATEYGGSIDLAADGGFALFGSTETYTQGPGDPADLIIYRLDANGAKQWRRHHGGPDDEGVIVFYY